MISKHNNLAEMESFFLSFFVMHTLIIRRILKIIFKISYSYTINSVIFIVTFVICLLYCTCTDLGRVHWILNVVIVKAIPTKIFFHSESEQNIPTLLFLIPCQNGTIVPECVMGHFISSGCCTLRDNKCNICTLWSDIDLEQSFCFI